jgi:hypothetical protein
VRHVTYKPNGTAVYLDMTSEGPRRHPWTLEFADGSTVTETEDGKERVFAGIFGRPDIHIFSFKTPAGIIGVNHFTGVFYVLGSLVAHPDYKRDLVGHYRHWHRVTRSIAVGTHPEFREDPAVEFYSLGMERVRPDRSSEILLVRFPHLVTSLDDVRVLTRYVYPGDGRSQADRNHGLETAGAVR